MDLLLTDEDITIKDNDLQLTTNDSSVVQELKLRLDTRLGEWFLNVNVGMPYFEDYFTKGANETYIKSLFNDEILKAENVKSIKYLDLEHNKETRNLLVNFGVITDFGLIKSELVL